MKGIEPGAMGMKPSDRFAINLCRDHHRKREAMGSESAFWAKYAPGFDYETHAAILWAETCSGEEMP